MWPEDEPLARVQFEKLARIQIAQWFPGWTLEYIDGLSYADRENIFAVMNAKALKRRRDAEKRESEQKKKPGRLRRR